MEQGNVGLIARRGKVFLNGVIRHLQLSATRHNEAVTDGDLGFEMDQPHVRRRLTWGTRFGGYLEVRVASVSWAMAPRVVWAELRPRRKSSSE